MSHADVAIAYAPSRCPICGAAGSLLHDGLRDFFVAAGRSREFAIASCGPCGVAYSIPPFDDEALAAYYPPTYEANVEKTGFLGALVRRKYRSDISRIIASSSRRGRLFEIGAGNGAFLATARRYGFSVAGIEPSAAGRAHALEAFDLELAAGFASSLRFSTRNEVVVARHVLEHLNEPKDCLEHIFKEGLVRGGLLFLKLPRLDSWEAKLFRRYWHGFDAPRHRLHFSKQGIECLLAEIGFDDIYIQSEVVPTDIARSLAYVADHAAGQTRRLARVATRAPRPLQLIASQALGWALSPLGPGRMIVMARKP